MAIDPYKQRTSPVSARLPGATPSPQIASYGNGLTAIAQGLGDVGAALKRKDEVLRQRQEKVDEDNERTSMIAELPGLVDEEQKLRDKIAASVGPSGAGFAELYREQHAQLMDKFNDGATTDVGLRLRRAYTGQAEVRAVQDGYEYEQQTRQTHTAGLYEEQFKAAALTAMGNPEAARAQLEVLVHNLDATGPETLTPAAKARLLTMRSYVAANAVAGLIDADPIKAKKDLNALVAGDEIKDNAWAYKMLDVDDVHKLMSSADQEIEVVHREAVEQRASALGSSLANLPPEIAVEQILALPPDMRGPTMSVYNMVTNARESAHRQAQQDEYNSVLDEISAFHEGPNAADPNAIAAMRTRVAKVKDRATRDQLLNQLEEHPRSNSDPRAYQAMIDLQTTRPLEFRDMDLLKVAGRFSPGDLKVFQNAQAEIRRTGTSAAVRTPEVNRMIKLAFKVAYGYEVDSDKDTLTPGQRQRQIDYLNAVNTALMAAQPEIRAGTLKPQAVIDSVNATVQTADPLATGWSGARVTLGLSPLPGPRTALFQVPAGTPITVSVSDIPADTYASLRRVLTRNGRKTTDAEIIATYKARLEEMRRAQ